MKSLSDYITVLRDTATNLNLHGESVEMVVQMLANALYISEVEQLAYTQEASLERATLDNSKIQHCVDQMYSVYRGANPRIILNIQSTKLFQFSVYDKIISSNNFNVYYLGYYDEKSEVIKYSDKVVYPDTMVTIVGLLASDIYETSWTSSYTNPYYATVTESNLSNDLYLDINGERSEVTRIFSDHIKEDIAFDLTLPGYGMRLYYPESLQGDTGINTSYSLTCYKYLSLSDLEESELKSIKLDGSIITDFEDDTYNREDVLLNLGADQTYPGIIYIDETSRDSIETIHHKANKARYVGSYLSTNQDLSWLLQEYYPSKIRTSGVTYKFEAPASTSLKTITSSRDLTSAMNSGGSFINFSDLKKTLTNWVESDLGYLPDGDLTIQYKKKSDFSGTNSSYDIISSCSVIPVNISGKDNITPLKSSIQIKVYMNTEGKTKSLTTYSELSENNLEVHYKYPSTQNNEAKCTSIDNKFVYIPINTYNIQSSSDSPLEVYLYKKDSDTSVLVDREIIPFNFIPVIEATVTTTTTTKIDSDGNIIKENVESSTSETSGSSFYLLNLTDDTLYLQTDYEGNVKSSNSSTAILYYNGSPVSATYSLLPVSDVEAEIDSSTGVITVSGMSSDVTEAVITIRAKYNEIDFTEDLTVKKSISNLSSDDKKSNFTIYSEDYTDPLLVQNVSKMDTNEITLHISSGKYKSLSVSLEDITFEKVIYEFTYQVINNVYSSTDSVVPTLYLYYIPYSGTNPLNSDEISEFIAKNKSYYVTQDIEISQGRSVVAKFDFYLDLYKNSTLDDTILTILQKYEYLFDQDFGDADTDTDTSNEIKSLVTKISEVRNVESMKVTYLNSSTREELTYDDVKNSKTPVYFIIECNISSIVKS